MSNPSDKPTIVCTETVPGKVDSISGEVAFDRDADRKVEEFLEKAIDEALPEWARGGKVRIGHGKPAPPDGH